MNHKIPLVSAALAATVVIAVGAGSARAQGDTSPPTSDPARGEFVCANLEQIQQLQADRAGLLEDRLTLLQEARTAAETGGKAAAVARIDRRVTRVTGQQAKVTERQQELADFAAANC